MEFLFHFYDLCRGTFKKQNTLMKIKWFIGRYILLTYLTEKFISIWSSLTHNWPCLVIVLRVLWVVPVVAPVADRSFTKSCRSDWKCKVRQTDVWCSSGRCHVQFCGWVQISFCLLHTAKVYTSLIARLQVEVLGKYFAFSLHYINM